MDGSCSPQRDANALQCAVRAPASACVAESWPGAWPVFPSRHFPNSGFCRHHPSSFASSLILPRRSSFKHCVPTLFKVVRTRFAITNLISRKPLLTKVGHRTVAVHRAAIMEDTLSSTAEARGCLLSHHTECLTPFVYPESLPL